MSDQLDQLAEQAAEALRKARIFIEYARYELEPELMPGAQFPSQKCADKEIARIDSASGAIAKLEVATQALREQLAQTQQERDSLDVDVENLRGWKDKADSAEFALTLQKEETAKWKRLATQRGLNYDMAVTERNKARDLAAEWQASYHRLRAEHERLKGN